MEITFDGPNEPITLNPDDLEFDHTNAPQMEEMLARAARQQAWLSVVTAELNRQIEDVQSTLDEIFADNYENVRRRLFNERKKEPTETAIKRELSKIGGVQESEEELASRRRNHEAAKGFLNAWINLGSYLQTLLKSHTESGVGGGSYEDDEREWRESQKKNKKKRRFKIIKESNA